MCHRGHRRRWATPSPFSDSGHSISKHEWKRPRKSGTSKWEVFLCADLPTYCVCFRVMAKVPFQLIQLHGCLLHPQNADMTALQNDGEIPQNINYLHPHSGNHHQNAIWRASASTRVCQQMLLCFLSWLTNSNTLVKYKQFRLLIVALRKDFHILLVSCLSFLTLSSLPAKLCYVMWWLNEMWGTAEQITA